MNTDSSNFKPGQLVHIKWEDASGCPAGWSDGEEHTHLELTNVVSVGYVHRVSERFVSVAPHTCMSVDEEFVSVMGMMSIPFSCILEWQALPKPGAMPTDQADTAWQLLQANESLQATNELLAADLVKLRAADADMRAQVMGLRGVIATLQPNLRTDSTYGKLPTVTLHTTGGAGTIGNGTNA